MQRAICLLSAGLDSATAMAMALKDNEVALALTFHYGQRAAAKEVENAGKLANHYKVPHRVIELSWMGEFKNALTSRVDLPKLTCIELSDPLVTAGSARAVYVPNRNGVFISVAAAIAESMDIRRIIVGFNAEEAATFPDNSLEYMEAMTRSLFYSTQNHVEVISPTAPLNKPQVLAEALRLDLPIRYLWSCYQGKEKMCAECESCQRLKRAFKENKVSDAEFFAN